MWSQSIRLTAVQFVTAFFGFDASQ